MVYVLIDRNDLFDTDWQRDTVSYKFELHNDEERVFDDGNWHSHEEVFKVGKTPVEAYDIEGTPLGTMFVEIDDTQRMKQLISKLERRETWVKNVSVETTEIKHEGCDTPETVFTVKWLLNTSVYLADFAVYQADAEAVLDVLSVLTSAKIDAVFDEKYGKMYVMAQDLVETIRLWEHSTPIDQRKE